MRLPWEQIAMEIIEVTAPELGAELYPDLDADVAEACAGWGVVKLIKWALARCPDHQPPSANAVVKGATAARQIARAAAWKGDPDVYVGAVAKITYAVLELVPGGIRVRGLDRYDAVWGDRNKDAWDKWKTAHPDRYSLGRRSSGGVPADFRPPDTDADRSNSPLPPSSKEGGSPKKLRTPRSPRRSKALEVGRRELGDCALCGGSAEGVFAGVRFCYGGCLAAAESWAKLKSPGAPWEADVAGWVIDQLEGNPEPPASPRPEVGA